MGEQERAEESPASVQRLIPDLDDELVSELVRVKELLLTLAAWEDDDPDGPPALPAPLAGRVALDALHRVQGQIAPTQSRSRGPGTRRPRVVGADGREEHRPLRLVELRSTDLSLLSAAAACLGQTLAVAPDSELADAIVAGAEASGGAFAPAPTGTDLVVTFARINGLLDLAVTGDTELLAARLRGARGDVVLTAGEDEAYIRLADRMNTMWAGGNTVDRWIY